VQTMVVNTFTLKGLGEDPNAVSANLSTLGLVADGFSKVRASLRMLHCSAESVDTTVQDLIAVNGRQSAMSCHG
jgi:hypothetical protein